MADQGDAYAGFIEAELKNERDRRAGLDARGLGVVTTSSALIALVLSLSVVVTGTDFTVSGLSAAGVFLSLLLFMVAGVAGILANANRSHEVASTETLNEMLCSHWTDTEVTARNIRASLNVRTLSTLRAGNNVKVGFLTAALVCQLVAIAALVVAIGRELLALS